MRAHIRLKLALSISAHAIGLTENLRLGQTLTAAQQLTLVTHRAEGRPEQSAQDRTSQDHT
jgi:hypothetical protein